MEDILQGGRDAYLKHKTKFDRCHCSDNFIYLKQKSNDSFWDRLESDKNLWCEKCFWSGVILPIYKIPECRKCKNDLELCRRLLDRCDKNIIELEVSCCSQCLWWEWFDYKRKILAKGKKITYIRKIKSKNGETIIVKF